MSIYLPNKRGKDRAKTTTRKTCQGCKIRKPNKRAIQILCRSLKAIHFFPLLLLRDQLHFLSFFFFFTSLFLCSQSFLSSAVTCNSPQRHLGAYYLRHLNSNNNLGTALPYSLWKLSRRLPVCTEQCYLHRDPP